LCSRAMAIEASARMEAAREGERLRTALIDSLTHELRTPLTSIRAAATTLLQGEGLDEAGRLDLAAIVDEESSRLDMLIGEAVEMAEIDANVVEVHLVPQHPRALLDQAVEESRKALAGASGGDRRRNRRPQAKRKAGGSGEGRREAGQARPGSIRTCWAGAAPPAGERGPAHPARQPHPAEQPPHGDRLEFRVEDDGPGIDAADLP
jgi:signal transduction histidine kinase